MEDSDRSRATVRPALAGPVAVAALALVAILVPGPGPGAPEADASPRAAAGPGADAGGVTTDTTVVDMTNSLQFTPAEITVTVGETVTWKNGSVLVHTVTAVPDSAAKDASVKLPEGAAPFGSGRLKPRGSFSHTFETPGTYRYFCIPHEAAGMTGTVHVKAGEG